MSDTDTDGVSVLANSLALDGGTIQATNDSTAATLTHSAITFANHKVDTQAVLLSNLNQADASPLTISATQIVEIEIPVALTLILALTRSPSTSGRHPTTST